MKNKFEFEFLVLIILKDKNKNNDIFTLKKTHHNYEVRQLWQIEED